MILLYLYNILMTGLSVIAKPYLYYRVRKGKEDPERVNERFGKASCMRPNGKLIWCHVASVGEAMSVKPLINQIEKEYPDMHILMTSGTLTSAKIIRNFYTKNVIHQFLPFDLKIWIERFLDHWQPDMVLWTESEIWPNFMQEIRKKYIPSYLINARISNRSFKRWSKTPKVFQFLLRTFKMCFPQNSETEQYLKHFETRHVKFLGNLKLSAAAIPVDTLKYEQLRNQLKGKHLYLLASSHEGEEVRFLKIHKALLRKHKKACLIIAPRHPNRGAEIEQLAIEKFKLNVNMRSSQTQITKDTNLYIADTIGEMGLFYQLASIVFMGGSFVPHGGHNPLEPCHFNCDIIFGKHMENFQDVALALLANDAAKQIMTSKDITAYLQKNLNSKAMDHIYATHAKTFIESQQDIPKLILDEIKNSFTHKSIFDL